MYFVFTKNERSDKIVFYILFKTQQPSDTVFLPFCAWTARLPTDRTVIKTRSVSQFIYSVEKKVTFERHVEGEKCTKNQEVHISSR